LSSAANNTLYSINLPAARCELIEGSSLLFPFEDRTTLWRHRGAQISMEQSSLAGCLTWQWAIFRPKQKRESIQNLLQKWS